METIVVRHDDTTYFLTVDNGIFWLENQDEEGMEMSEKNVFDMLDQEFKENF